MANILRGYGLARESGYFKVEQEADVQRRRQRLLKEGKLPAEPPPGEAGASRQRKEQPFNDSEHNYDTLAEVLQQRARLDDPHALRRKEYERRVKGEPEPPSEADLLRARSKMHALGASVGHVPRMSMGRDRYSVPQPDMGGGGDALMNFRQLTPEAREVASRTYVAGVRALVYGSLLGAIGLAAGATYAIRSLDIKSGEDFGDRVRQGLSPLSVGVQRWVVPIKERAQAWLGPEPAVAGQASGGSGGGGEQRGAGLAAEAGQSPTAEFSRRLADRFAKRGAAGGGSSSGGSGSGVLD